MRAGFLAVALAATVAACATTQEAETGPQGCVVVDNSDGSGTQARIFLVSVQSGWRLGMGEVGMGRKLEFCTRRVAIPERVVILIERPAAGGRSPMSGARTQPRVSPEFVLRLDDVWTWDPALNTLSRAIVFQD